MEDINWVAVTVYTLKLCKQVITAKVAFVWCPWMFSPWLCRSGSAMWSLNSCRVIYIASLFHLNHCRQTTSSFSFTRFYEVCASLIRESSEFCVVRSSDFKITVFVLWRRVKIKKFFQQDIIICCNLIYTLFPQHVLLWSRSHGIIKWNYMKLSRKTFKKKNTDDKLHHDCRVQNFLTM